MQRQLTMIKHWLKYTKREVINETRVELGWGKQSTKEHKDRKQRYAGHTRKDSFKIKQEITKLQSPKSPVVKGPNRSGVKVSSRVDWQAFVLEGIVRVTGEFRKQRGADKRQPGIWTQTQNTRAEQVQFKDLLNKSTWTKIYNLVMR